VRTAPTPLRRPEVKDFSRKGATAQRKVANLVYGVTLRLCGRNLPFAPLRMTSL
jgi:hypothetical protein